MEYTKEECEEMFPGELIPLDDSDEDYLIIPLPLSPFDSEEE